MGTRANNWSVAEVNCMINLWSQKSILSIFDSSHRNTKAYLAIQHKMSDAGFERSAVQIQAKLKNLRHHYHRAKDVMRKDGAPRGVALNICPQFQEIDAFLGPRSSLNPEHINHSKGLLEEDSTDVPDVYLVNCIYGQDDQNEKPELQKGNEEPVVPVAQKSKPKERLPMEKVIIPQVDESCKRKAGEDICKIMKDIAKEDREHQERLQEKLWNRLIESEEAWQKRTDEMFEARMRAQEDALKGMMGMMGQMMNIMSRMVPQNGISTAFPNTSVPDYPAHNNYATSLSTSVMPPTSTKMESEVSDFPGTLDINHDKLGPQPSMVMPTLSNASGLVMPSSTGPSASNYCVTAHPHPRANTPNSA